MELHRDGLLIGPGENRDAMNLLFSWLTVDEVAYRPGLWHWISDDGQVYRSPTSPVIPVSAEGPDRTGGRTPGTPKLDDAPAKGQ